MTSKNRIAKCESGHKYNASEKTCPACKASNDAPTDRPPAPDAPSDATWGDVVAASNQNDGAGEAASTASPTPAARHTVRSVTSDMAVEDLEAKRKAHLAKLHEIDRIKAELDAEDNRHKSEKKSIEARIETAEGEEHELRFEVESAKTTKLVDCRLEIRGSNVHVIREDTSEVIDVRAATKEELQTSFLADDTVNPPPENDAAAALADGAKKKRGRKPKGEKAGATAGA